MTTPTCADIMTPVVFTLPPDAPIDQAAGLLLRERVSGCPVVDGDRVVGVLSELDLLRALYPASQGEPAAGTVRDHMTPTPMALHADASAIDAAHFFFEYPVRRAPVVDREGRLLGLISRRDVLCAFEELARTERVGRADLSTPPPALRRTT